ncbi:MAG TPA: alpha/beta family hydrolase [Micropruina sp.]|jgi:predicted alpha/beta-hydrolase family hydrolase|nr:alpha/beta family hydrolase [Micropruina sp.]
MTSYLVETPLGPCRLTVSAADDPRAVLLLGHGAGGGIEAFDLVACAQGLPRRGVLVIRHEQPWRVAGRKTVARPDVVDQGWRPALDQVLAAFPDLPVWVGGRSAGARGACRNFDERQAGVICLAFPLHPPGRPDVSRIAELAGVAGRVLVVQGERDPFGSPQDVRDAAEAAGGAQPTVVAMAGTHSFTRRADVRDGIVSAVADFIGA